MIGVGIERIKSCRDSNVSITRVCDKGVEMEVLGLKAAIRDGLLHWGCDNFMIEENGDILIDAETIEMENNG